MTGRLISLVSALILLGAPAQAALPGPSTTTAEPATTISGADLVTMKHYYWDVRNVPARHVTISRSQAIAIANRPGSKFRVTEAALTRVTTRATGKEFFDVETGQWSIRPAVDHRLMWTIVAVAKIRSAVDPGSLGGPLVPGPDPRTVTTVNPLTGDVVLPRYVAHPRPVLTWTVRWAMLIDPDTGDEPTGMSL
jgi:hypothetical protein